MKANVCNCFSDKVQINMNIFIHILNPPVKENIKEIEDNDNNKCTKKAKYSKNKKQ